MDTPFTTKPTLHGDLVVLRPFTGADAEVMVEIIADPDVARLTGSVNTTAELGVRMDLEQARSWYGSRSEQTDRLDLAVVDRETGHVVGEVVLNEWDPVCRSANFRTLMGPAGRNRGLGTEAARLIVGYGFDQVGLHRISLEVFAFNPRAERVYRKVGFVHEGTRREVLRFDDEWVDAHDMAVLEQEWSQHQGRV